MAQITPTAQIVHANLTQSRKKLVWALMKANPLYAWLTANGRMDGFSGGTEITNPLVYGRNPNIVSYSYYDELPLAQTNEFETVSYGWSRVAGSVIISQEEEDENQGETKIFDLVKTKMQVLEVSLQEKFSEYLYGSGAGKDPNGLGNLVPDDPTTGTLGGLSRVTNEWWRNSSYDFAGAIDSSNFEQAMDDIELDMTVKKKKPDVIFMGRDLWRIGKQAIRDKFTIDVAAGQSAEKKMYDLQFKGFTWGGIQIILDQDCDPDKMYWINSEFLRGAYLRKVNWVTKKLTAPWNVEASGSRIVWQGQFCTWNQYRSHAVVNN